MQTKRLSTSLVLAAVLGVAALGFTSPPASAATASVACPDGTWAQNVKDCNKHVVMASVVGANPPPPKPANTSIFDRWGNLLKIHHGGTGPTNPPPPPLGGHGVPGSELKMSSGADVPMPMPMP